MRIITNLTGIRSWKVFPLTVCVNVCLFIHLVFLAYETSDWQDMWVVLWLRS